MGWFRDKFNEWVKANQSFEEEQAEKLRKVKPEDADKFDESTDEWLARMTTTPKRSLNVIFWLTGVCYWFWVIWSAIEKIFGPLD